MTLKMNDATKNARLYDVNCTADAQGMNLWVEELLHRYQDSICCGKYQSVFRCMNIKDENVLIGAAGRLVGMRIQQMVGSFPVWDARFKGNWITIASRFSRLRRPLKKGSKAFRSSRSSRSATACATN